MKLLNYFIYITLVSFLQRANTSENFVLITMLYNEINQERITEYITCLEKNIENPIIDCIHIIYDTSSDQLTNTHPLKEYIQEKKNIITYTDERPGYGFFFWLANNHYPNKKIIIANADIYFNESLYFLQNYDLTNQFIILTRWNVIPDGSLTLYRSRYSQDAWIFKSPLAQLEQCNICPGRVACDSQIAYFAICKGLTVSNPCLTIQACHIHNSGIRNYFSEAYYTIPKRYRPPRFTRLSKTMKPINQGKIM